MGPQQRREALGDTVEGTVVFAALLRALDALDCVPLVLHRVGGGDVGRALVGGEDVRVAPDELGTDPVERVRDGEVPALGGQLREEDPFEEEIADLAPKLRHIALLDGLDHLVGFLDHEGHQGLQRLLAIPRGTRRASGAFA